MTWPARLRISVLSHLPFWAAVNWDLRKALAVMAVPLVRMIMDWPHRARGFARTRLRSARRGL
jgi:hypothetical protein